MIKSIVEKISAQLNAFRASKFAKDAAWLLLFNTLSKAIGFLGSARAARMLGPVNVGISGLIQANALQTSLVYNCGFDTVAVRKISSDKESCHTVTATIVCFRLCASFICSILWVIVCYLWIEEAHRSAWLMGVPLLILPAASTVFAFQGLEKLPIQNAIGAAGSIVSASAYFLFFTPGMFLGADLIVISVVGLITAVFSWSAYFRLFKHWPVALLNWAILGKLIKESWRFWLLMIIVYFYSVFQIPLVSYLLGPEKTGIFRSAFMMAAGVELLFSSINSLLLARLVNWQKLGLQTMWKKQSRLLLIFLVIALPIITMLVVTAPFFFRILLGAAFSEGIIVFQILVMGRMVVFIGQIYAWGLVAANRDTQFLYASILGAACSVTMNLFLIPVYGIVGAAIISVISEIVVHFYCYLSLRITLIKHTGGNNGL